MHANVVSERKDNAPLSQLWPSCHTLYPRQLLVSWTIAIVDKEEEGEIKIH